MQNKLTPPSGEGNSVSPQLDSMTTVQSINVGLGLSDYSSDATTPTTPRAPIPPPSHPIQHASNEISMSSAPATPTRLSFGGMTAQRPLPTSPFRNSFSTPNQSATEQKSVEPDRPVSQHSVDTNASQDVAMDDSDGEGDAGSDVEGFDAEGGGGSKKKKGQRFFCTEFPPCKLSFTRSEHLARHIRKHTGERPFQCHCSRRFSRLDNLRQHAQTVHVNEEIPMDSLAATGTRFQRQIRTDRVARPAGSRSRASTAGSQGSHPRGHGRNLSTSSIGSTASTISRDDSRKRPPPLIMANDPSRARLSLDVLRTQPSTPPGQTSFFRDSSEGVSTPTSTTYSTGQNSPGYGSSLGSPVSTGRGSGYWENRGHSRRLSVPSGPKPFQSPQGLLHGGSPYLSPLASSQASGFSNLSSSFGSPINESHRFVTREAAEAELRRRTWHPTPHNYTNFSRPGISGASFSRPATSGLSYYQTPDAPHPSYASNATAAASGSQTLPGIASFDPPPQPATPPPRGPSPMQIDQSAQPAASAGRQLEPRAGPAKGHASWDMSLHQNLTRLDLRGNPLPQEPQGWSQPALRPYEAGRTTASASQQQPPPQLAPVTHQDGSPRSGDRFDHSGASSARAKRQGWYAGPPSNPVTSHPRVSPGESTGSEGVPKTPSTPAVDHDLSIRHSNGFVESIPRQLGPAATRHIFTGEKPQQQSWPLPSSGSTQQFDPAKDTEMSGLDVLVAAATREENAAPRA